LAAAAAVLVAVPLRMPNLWWLAPAIIALVALAFWSRSAPVIRAALTTAAVTAVYYATLPLGVPAVGTLAVCVVLLAAYPVFARWPLTRPDRHWLTVGRFTPVVWVLLGVVVAGSALALVVWTSVADPPPPPFLAGFDDAPVWVVGLAVAGFSLVNSVWEEALYRGVLQNELTDTLGVAPAIAVQAAAFGFAHLHGFPSGWVGVLMAGGWGVFLGVLRLKSGGMAAPYVAHIAADTTIAVLAVTLLR
jgi:membrane protease YdiL (CAAX protease family)